MTAECLQGGFVHTHVAHECSPAPFLRAQSRLIPLQSSSHITLVGTSASSAPWLIIASSSLLDYAPVHELHSRVVHARSCGACAVMWCMRGHVQPCGACAVICLSYLIGSPSHRLLLGRPPPLLLICPTSLCKLLPPPQCPILTLRACPISLCLLAQSHSECLPQPNLTLPACPISLSVLAAVLIATAAMPESAPDPCLPAFPPSFPSLASHRASHASFVANSPHPP